LLDHLGKPAALLATYGTIVSLLYLFGFWGHLGINALEYIGLADIVRLSLYPMLISLAAILFGFLVSNWSNQNVLPPGEGKGSKLGKALNKYGQLIAIAWGIGAFLVFQSQPETTRWSSLGFMLMPYSIALSNIPAVMNAIPNDRVRTTIMALAVLLPPLVYGTGVKNAEKIRTADVDYAIDASRLPEALALRSTARKPILYVGQLGNRIALYETLSKQVVLVREDQISVLPIREK
jgi:hypothetical protein